MKHALIILTLVPTLFGLLSPLTLRAAAPKDWKADKAPEVPKSIRVERDVTYLAADRREKADVYFPPALKPGHLAPAVLLIHGGGFNDGDKARGREVQMGVELALHGYVCMSINYRLWNTGVKSPTWPQSLFDAKTAVRWLRSEAARLQVDPERIGVFGNSAGGNLAAMLAVTTPDDGLEPAAPMPGVSTRVKCAIDFYGALDLPNYHDMKMFLQTRAENPAVYRKASPVTYVKAGAAPMLLVHGTADETVPHSQAETMAVALKKAGVEHHLEIVPDAPHTFALVSAAKDFRPLVFAFLDKQLQPAKP